MVVMGIHSANSLIGTGPLGHVLRYYECGLISSDEKHAHSLDWWSEFCTQLPALTKLRTTVASLL